MNKKKITAVVAVIGAVLILCAAGLIYISASGDKTEEAAKIIEDTAEEAEPVKEVSEIETRCLELLEEIEKKEEILAVLDADTSVYQNSTESVTKYQKYVDMLRERLEVLYNDRYNSGVTGTGVNYDAGTTGTLENGSNGINAAIDIVSMFVNSSIFDYFSDQLKSDGSSNTDYYDYLIGAGDYYEEKISPLTENINKGISNVQAKLQMLNSVTDTDIEGSKILVNLSVLEKIGTANLLNYVYDEDFSGLLKDIQLFHTYMRSEAVLFYDVCTDFSNALNNEAIFNAETTLEFYNKLKMNVSSELYYGEDEMNPYYRKITDEFLEYFDYVMQNKDFFGVKTEEFTVYNGEKHFVVYSKNADGVTCVMKIDEIQGSTTTSYYYDYFGNMYFADRNGDRTYYTGDMYYSDGLRLYFENYASWLNSFYKTGNFVSAYENDEVLSSYR